MRIALVGTGIAGMSCAHKLYPHAEISLYEREERVGGHTHTVDVKEGDRSVSMDTGFMVYNEHTYPLLVRLFDELGVETMETDMSFAVHHRPDQLYFKGSDLSSLFAQKRNLLRPIFWRMIKDILKFNRSAQALLGEPGQTELSLSAFVRKLGLGQPFLNYYLLPMTSAIWSTPPDEMLDFPALTLITFLRNHGLLGVNSHFQWRTVRGGSRNYRDRLIAPFLDRFHLSRPARSIRRTDSGVEVVDEDGRSESYNAVVLATHADEALALLEAPEPDQQRLLSVFNYSDNGILLHTDTNVMPPAQKAWASWNYCLDTNNQGQVEASTHYWMNSLQNVCDQVPYFVSVNGQDLVDPDKVLRRMRYTHPQFNRSTAMAQRELHELNQNGPIYFCGSYFRYGFHEDALMSGYAAAERILNPSAANEPLPL